VVVAGPSAGQPDAGVDHTGLVATRGDHHGLIHEIAWDRPLPGFPRLPVKTFRPDIVAKIADLD